VHHTGCGKVCFNERILKLLQWICTWNYSHTKCKVQSSKCNGALAQSGLISIASMQILFLRKRFLWETRTFNCVAVLLACVVRVASGQWDPCQVLLLAASLPDRKGRKTCGLWQFSGQFTDKGCFLTACLAERRLYEWSLDAWDHILTSFFHVLSSLLPLCFPWAVKPCKRLNGRDRPFNGANQARWLALIISTAKPPTVPTRHRAVLIQSHSIFTHRIGVG
jgi:hypothetical protein